MKVDKVTIRPITLEKAENHFNYFAESALSYHDMPFDNFVATEKQCESHYRSLNMVEVLCEKLSNLVEKLMEDGKLNMAGVITSRLVKFKFIPPEMREKYIKQALEIAEFQDDSMHVVARLENLHKEYEKRGQTEKLRKVLVREESTLKIILSDFDTAIEKFRTVGDKERDIDNFRDLLATTQVDLAKILLHSDPKKAIKKLKSAVTIFRDLGDDKRYNFAQMLIRMAKENLYGDNYLEF